MKNPLAIVTKNEVVKNAGKEVSKFVLAHEGLLFTGGTIAFNAAGIVATYKNAARIQQIISETRETLKTIGGEDEKKQCVKVALKELTPLVAPIIIFFVGSTTCAVVGHKKSQAKIATLTAALSLAQSTINEYDLFKKEVEAKVGEEAFKEIKTEVVGKQIEDDLASDKVPSKYVNTTMGAIGEVLIYIPDFGVYFTGSQSRIEMAFEHINLCLSDNGATGKYSYGSENELGGEIVFVEDLFDELGVPNEARPGLARDMGWDASRNSCVTYWIGDGHTNSGVPYLTIEFGDRSKPYPIEPMPW